MPPVINAEKCIACSKCVEICSEDVFYGSQKKTLPEIHYPGECWHCHACVEICPVEGAIKLRIPLPMKIVYK
jgi:NAD-dependent dihydropyrimidine dehydrogenase PreA subunit